jgi:hypothetical protein
MTSHITVEAVSTFRIDNERKLPGAARGAKRGICGANHFDFSFHGVNHGFPDWAATVPYSVSTIVCF